ncbi:MAG: hypothetical protein V8T45_00140 [Oscillospiraceae bacterium]
MDGYPVTAYDEQSKTLTLCFKEFMDEMGDQWPVEVDIKILLDGELLPGPGKLQLPEPQETESLSLSLPQPVEYSLEGMDNSLYLLGVELKPYALAGVMSWAGYERFIGDVETWDDLDKAGKRMERPHESLVCPDGVAGHAKHHGVPGWRHQSM